MKLFWQELQKYITISSQTRVKYQPRIIKFSLNVAAKSSPTYKDLQFDSKIGTENFKLNKTD